MKKNITSKNLFIKETQLIVNHIKKNIKKKYTLTEPYFDKFDKKYLLKCIESFLCFNLMENGLKNLKIH